MISIALSLMMIGVIIVKYFKKKDTVTELIIYSLISPYIQIGSSYYDSMYFACIAFMLAVAIANRGHIKLVHGKWATRYFLLIAFLCGVYFFAWLIFSRVDVFTTLTSILGIIKCTLMIYFAYVMNRGIKPKGLINRFGNALKFLIIANLFACIVQLYSVSLGSAIVNIFRDEQSSSYLRAVTQWHFFSRCFGVMSTPMALGIFALIASAFFLMAEEDKKRRYIFLVFSIIVGACSASKSFWVGIVLLFVIIFLTEVRFLRNRKAYFIMTALLILGGLVVMFYSQIGNLIQNTIGPTYAYYWRAIGDISRIFSTRYSADSEYLGFMPEFLKSYWLLGVGPSSIDGELAIDSAFANLLHNGGIIALGAVVAFYAQLLVHLWKIRNQRLFAVALLLLFTGFGFQTWIGAPITTFLQIYIFFMLDTKQQIKETARSAAYRELPARGFQG